MGWLWTTPSQPKTSAPGQSPPTQSPPPKPIETDYGDAELERFIASFQADAGTKPAEKPLETNPSPPSPPSAPKSSWFSMRSSPTASIASSAPGQPSPSSLSRASSDPVGESALPTDMSCRQAFDLAFHCQSLGGQFLSVYRHGSMRSCSEHWKDFWFCMRVKGYTSPSKEEMIRAHYRAKEHAKYGDGKPSSQDIWEARKEKLPLGAAFSVPYNPPEETDEEFQQRQLEKFKRGRAEIERREAAKSGIDS